MKSAQLKCTASWGELHILVYSVDTFGRIMSISKPGSIRKKQSTQTSLHTLDLTLLLQKVETFGKGTLFKTLHNTILVIKYYEKVFAPFLPNHELTVIFFDDMNHISDKYAKKCKISKGANTFHSTVNSRKTMLCMLCTIFQGSNFLLETDIKKKKKKWQKSNLMVQSDLSNLCCVDSPSHRAVCPELTSCLFLSGTSENSRQTSRVSRSATQNMTDRISTR